MIRKVAFLVLSIICVGHAYAVCDDKFVDGVGPHITVVANERKATFICYTGYALMTSGVTRTAIWSAEHLTAASITAARQLPRVDSFHADPNLPFGDRAENIAYARSGFDRGHMSPNGDADSVQAQYDTFSLANMIPQNHDNNAHLWEGIESAARTMAKYDGEVYVVTGPLFIGKRGRIGGTVEVPNFIWKAVFDPKRGAGAYITKNVAGYDYTVVSIDELIRVAGVDPFPSISQEEKQRAFAMPRPRPNGKKLDVGPVSENELGLGEGFSTVDGPVSDFVGAEGVGRGYAEHAALHEAARLLHGY